MQLNEVGAKLVAVKEKSQMKEVPSVVMLKKSGANITTKEDDDIVFVWIHISEDPVKGVDQRGEIFNEHITVMYNRNLKPDGYPDQNIESVTNVPLLSRTTASSSLGTWRA